MNNIFLPIFFQFVNEYEAVNLVTTDKIVLKKDENGFYFEFITGRNITKSKYFKNREDALKWLSDILEKKVNRVQQLQKEIINSTVQKSYQIIAQKLDEFIEVNKHERKKKTNR